MVVLLDGEFPARSRSVEAPSNWNCPEFVVEVNDPHDVPPQAPVTVNVTVVFPLLSANEPANVTVRVLKELELR